MSELQLEKEQSCPLELVMIHDGSLEFGVLRILDGRARILLVCFEQGEKEIWRVSNDQVYLTGIENYSTDCQERLLSFGHGYDTYDPLENVRIYEIQL